MQVQTLFAKTAPLFKPKSKHHKIIYDRFIIFKSIMIKLILTPSLNIERRCTISNNKIVQTVYTMSDLAPHCLKLTTFSTILLYSVWTVCTVVRCISFNMVSCIGLHCLHSIIVDNL